MKKWPLGRWQVTCGGRSSIEPTLTRAKRWADSRHARNKREHGSTFINAIITKIGSARAYWGRLGRYGYVWIALPPQN